MSTSTHAYALPSSKAGTRIFIITLILLLAAALRITDLTQQSLWTDEGFTYNVITRADMLPEIAADTHPPLYYALLRGWVAVAGDSVFALRFFSIIPSLLSVAMMAPLARVLTKDRALAGAPAVPALAALGLALADSENFLAQEIRMYTLTTLLAIFSMYAYVRWYRAPDLRWGVAWTISTTALIYTYYLGLYIPLIQGLHALLFLRGRVRLGAIGYLAVSGVLFLPWFLGVTLDQLATPPPYEMFNSQPSNGDTLLDLRDQYLTGQWALMAALAGLGVVTLVYTDRIHVHWQRLREPALVLMWALLPVVITFVANAWLPILTPRKLALIAPALALLVAWGLGNLRQPTRGLLVGVLVVYGVATVDFYQLKEPWNRVAENMTHYALPGDAALMEVGLGGYPLGYYLDHSTAFSRAGSSPARNLPRWRDDVPATYEAELGDRLAEHDTVWLAHWSPETRIFDLLAAAGLTRTATLTTDHLGNDLNVYRYDRLPDEPIAAYASGMTLQAAEFHDNIGRLDLWWTADETPDQDYSVSAFALDESGRLAAQHDSFPFENMRPTTSWAAGELVFDPHWLDTSDLPAGRYTLGVKVYTYQDGVVYPTEEGEEYAVVGELVVP
jgi:uncharacterized membrane protein